jgi:hypothetical protein
MRYLASTAKMPKSGQMQSSQLAQKIQLRYGCETFGYMLATTLAGLHRQGNLAMWELGKGWRPRNSIIAVILVFVVKFLS